ncbi:MAG: hypothetical protein AAF739_00475 [Pseudomonadota bacterium]
MKGERTQTVKPAQGLAEFAKHVLGESKFFGETNGSVGGTTHYISWFHIRRARQSLNAFNKAMEADNG